MVFLHYHTSGYSWYRIIKLASWLGYAHFVACLAALTISQLRTTINKGSAPKQLPLIVESTLKFGGVILKWDTVVGTTVRGTVALFDHLGHILKRGIKRGKGKCLPLTNRPGEQFSFGFQTFLKEGCSCNDFICNNHIRTMLSLYYSRSV